MKVFVFQTNKELNRYLTSEGCLCEFRSYEENKNLGSSYVAIANLDKLKNLVTLQKISKQCEVIGITNTSEFQERYSLWCRHVFSNNEESYPSIFKAIKEIYSKDFLIPVEGTKDLWIYKNKFCIKCKEENYIIPPSRWRILFLLAQFPKQFFSLDQLVNHCVPIGSNTLDPKNTMETVICKITKTLYVITGERVIYSIKGFYSLNKQWYEKTFRGEEIEIKLKGESLNFLKDSFEQLQTLFHEECLQMLKAKHYKCTKNPSRLYYNLYNRLSNKRSFSLKNFHLLLKQISWL